MHVLQNGILFSAAENGLPLPVYLLCLCGVLLVTYLIGSVNSAVFLSRVCFGDDVREHGSGNAGLTNMLRTFGAKGAVLTLVCDVCKTLLCIALGGAVLGLAYAGPYSLGPGGYLGVAGCILGHNFPVFFGFRGGKGVLVTAVGILTLQPVVFCPVFLVFVVLVAFTKYVSLGSVVAAGMYPVFLHSIMKYAFSGMSVVPYVTLFSFGVTILVVWRHRSNLGRLWRGEENKLSLCHGTKKTEDRSHE